jgi:hypothetical protein
MPGPAEVHEDLPVDAREALGNHDLKTEIAGGVGRVFTGGGNRGRALAARCETLSSLAPTAL